MIISKETGRSMVEMLGVLAIIGVLSAAGLAGYSKAMAKHKFNQTVDQISMIISNITNTFINEEDYSSLGTTKEGGTANAIALKVFPGNMVQPDGRTVLNAYKGNVYVYAVDYDGVKNGAFKVEYENLPQEATVAFAIAQTNVENQMMMNINISSSSQNE